MKLNKWTTAMVGALALVMCLAPMALADGVLKVAVSDEPPALDQQVITSDLATMIAQHMFEGLYTFDSTYKPVPMLAEGADVKDGGKLISLNLRQGVKFHNGGEMTSADVVASLQRWGKFGSRGPVLCPAKSGPKGLELSWTTRTRGECRVTVFRRQTGQLMRKSLL